VSIPRPIGHRALASEPEWSQQPLRRALLFGEAAASTFAEKQKTLAKKGTRVAEGPLLDKAKRLTGGDPTLLLRSSPFPSSSAGAVAGDGPGRRGRGPVSHFE